MYEYSYCTHISHCFLAIAQFLHANIDLLIRALIRDYFMRYDLTITCIILIHQIYDGS